METPFSKFNKNAICLHPLQITAFVLCLQLGITKR